LAALQYTNPGLVATPGIQAFRVMSVLKAQNAVFRRGDFLQNVTTGSIVFPSPQGSMATTTPTAAVTTGTTTSSGAPAQFYYYYYTYTGSSNESLPSAEGTIYVPAGYEGTITVPSAGAPAAATGWSLYVGLVQGNEWQQVTGTGLGSAATIPYPLTNSIGANRAANDAHTNILGLAVDDYDVYYAPNQGSPGTSNRSPFGIDVTAPPSGFLEQYQAKVWLLSAGQRFEMSVLQPYPVAQFGTFGLLYESTGGANAFVADNTQTDKPLTYVGKVQGPTNPTYDSVGTNGDTGWRGIFTIASTAVLF